jgi:hypothetical protein
MGNLWAAESEIKTTSTTEQPWSLPFILRIIFTATGLALSQLA